MTVSIDQLFNDMRAIIDEFLESLYDSSSMQRDVVSHSDFVIRDIDYLVHVDFVGVAHFSGRSISDALKAIIDTQPVGICLELCPYRYEYLKRIQEDPFAKAFSSGKNELATAVDLLGGVEVDVWLVDMNQEEIAARVLALASLDEARAWKRIQKHLVKREEVGLMLWEEGFKDEAMKVFKGDVGLMRRTFPTLWKVLILERNIFMACSLIYLILHYLESGLQEFKIILLVGAAHVEGIKQLLKQPKKAFQALESLGISFRKPYAKSN
jgi:pheromone shutdown protein TraB